MLSRKPRVGEEIQQPDGDTSAWKDFGVIVEVSHNLCYVKLPNGNTDIFIWQFNGTLNNHFRIGLTPKQRTKQFFDRVAGETKS